MFHIRYILRRAETRVDRALSHRTAHLGEETRFWDVVIVENAIERPVDTIINVVHVFRIARFCSMSTSNDQGVPFDAESTDLDRSFLVRR